jgi:hypothetical protein
MTANELRYNILVGIDSLYVGTSPGYNDKQISSIINRAQRRVFRDYARLFDTNEKIKRILAPLVYGGSLLEGNITATADTTITNYSHSVTSLLTGTFYTLPVGVGRLLEEQVYLTANAVTVGPVLVLPISYDYYLKNYKNRYKKPYVDLVWRMDAKLESGSPTVEIIYPATHTVADYIISYLKYPEDITVNVAVPASQVDCEIPDASFQDEIIGESIKIIKSSLEDGSYETVTIEKKFDEN